MIYNNVLVVYICVCTILTSNPLRILYPDATKSRGLDL